MKSVFYLCLAVLFLSSCKNNKHPKELKIKELIKEKTIEGVWELVGFYNYKDNKIVDSFMSNDTYRQIKIYTPTKVMWSRLNGLDSTDWFGYGDYKTTDSTLTETIYYGSNSMNKAIEKSNKFNFELILNGTTYSQVYFNDEGDRVLAENYIRIE